VTDRDRDIIDVLVPTFERPVALAVTLAGLAGQTHSRFDVTVSDQSESAPSWERPEVEAIVRTLRAQGHNVSLLRHVPRRGMAEHRDFLLSLATAEQALFLDDDLWLEPHVIERLCTALRAEACGFVGCAPIGLSYVDDRRPSEQTLELWDGPVTAEKIAPTSAEWERHRLHNAANIWHVQDTERVHAAARQKNGLAYTPYHVAWVGGCVLYDTAKLREVGGFGFWRQLPHEHAGEDVLAQLRVMARFGGCGILPSGVVHLELPTTVENRDVDAPRHLTPHPCQTGPAGN